MLNKKYTFIFLLLPVFSFFSFLSVPEDGIRITVTRLHNQKGHVLVSLFKDGVGYPDDAQKALRKAQLDINGNSASVLFTGLPAGTYAVSVLHDENDDRQMNKNSLGLPKEGFGFSNNVVGAFGPPSWSRTAFSHKPGLLSQKEIKIRY